MGNVLESSFAIINGDICSWEGQKLEFGDFSRQKRV